MSKKVRLMLGDEAIAQGAKLIVHQQECKNYSEEVAYLQVPDSAVALGVMVGNFYGNPSKQLKLVGVTGTNGKTSIATFLYHLVEEMGEKAGLISTVENSFYDTSTARIARTFGAHGGCGLPLCFHGG